MMHSLIVLQILLYSSLWVVPSSSFLNAATKSPRRRVLCTVFGATTNYQVEVSLDGRSSIISVNHGESILNALERQMSSFIPSDCRRGNCLTCAGMHVDGSVQASLVQKENGLSPDMDAFLLTKKYVLTCSSYVVGNGIKLQLGINDKVWDVMYKDRIQEGEKVQRLCQEASARAMRKAAQANIEDWKRKTEKTLREFSDAKNSRSNFE